MKMESPTGDHAPPNSQETSPAPLRTLGFMINSPQRVFGMFDVERLSGTQKLQLEFNRKHFMNLRKLDILAYTKHTLHC